MVIVLGIAVLSYGVIANDLANSVGNGYNMRINGLRLDDISGNKIRATGNANILAISSSEGENNVRIVLSMNNLDYKSGNTFDGWLVNNMFDKVIYLGSFKVASNGIGHLLYCKKQLDFVPFTYILVTQRTKSDNLKEILFGNIATDP